MPNIDFDQVRHPDWLRYYRRWEMAFDFWRGGLCVLDPDHAATQVLYGDEVVDGTKPVDDPSRTTYQWSTVWENSYLFKHQRETRDEYEDRHRRCVNLPLFQYTVNVLAAGVLRALPQREIPGDSRWKEIHGDIDMAGTDVEAFMRRALSLALVFGRMHAVCDRVAFESLAASRLEQEARGERAYTYLITPLDLVDWDLDDNGNFKWAVVHESPLVVRRPGIATERPKVRQRYRVWYPDHWVLWEGRDTEGQVEASEAKFRPIQMDVHDVGRVPIETLYCTRMPMAAGMACETPLPDVLDLNRHLVNELSELNETDRLQAFSQLAIPVGDGAFIAGIDLGPKRAFQYPASDGEPHYLDPNPQHPAGRWERISEKVHTGRQLAAISRGKAEYSKEERSASAIAIESEDKRNQLAWWCRALEGFDNGVHSCLAAWEGLSESPKATYALDFERKDVMVECQELQTLSQVPVFSEARKAQAAVGKRIIGRMLTEQGAEAEDIKGALADIDSAASKPPPEPAMPAAPFGKKPGGPPGQKPKPFGGQPKPKANAPA